MDCRTGDGRVLNPQIEHLHQPDYDQVNRHNQIEQSRNRQNQDACNERDNAAQPEIYRDLLSKEEMVKHGVFLWMR